MPILEKQVRVFVSSTFRDMHAERDHLVTVVFPELRERVEQLGLEFFDVDLRWGVPEKTVDGETANSWDYCRQWIDRVEPLFVCILGQRYGWVPKVTDFKDGMDQARQASAPRSITDLEVRHAVLDDRRKRRSYFYLRETFVPELAPGSTDEQRKIRSEFVDPPELLIQLDALKDEVRACGRPVRGYECRWTGLEFADLDKAEKKFGPMVLEDLWSGVLRDERYVSKAVWHRVLGADPDADPRYSDESQPVPRELWERIVEEAKPLPEAPRDAERQQMDAFAASRLRWFKGRTHELQKLTDFIRDPALDAPRLAVVAAVPGQGKTALLAKLKQIIQERASGVQAPPFLFTHFVGATERSAAAHATVERLLSELDHSDIEWPSGEQREGEEPKRDFNNLCLQLAKRLCDYAGERRIVILLDALNQLTDGHDLHWLPVRFGPSVRVIVSCVADASAKADSPEQRVLHALAALQPAPLRISLGPLTEEDVRTIVIEYLQEYCKELDREHVDAICHVEQAKNPLYLLVMLGELRTLGGNDMNRIVGARIATLANDYPDTVSLFRWVLQRLEVFGSESVQWWCLYLAHGRVGMASHELTELLARKFVADAAATALRIERGLRRYLLRRGAQFDFFHGQLRQAVFEKYQTQAEAVAVHSDIADYFNDMADPEKIQSWKCDKPRPLLQLVFHLAGAQRHDELCRTLCDLRFVESRCHLFQVFELSADYRLAQESLPEAQEIIRKERIREKRIRRWTEEIIEYSCKWSERRIRMIQGEVAMGSEPIAPEPVPTAAPWSEESIRAECGRILHSPTRFARLEAFAGFVNGQCHLLLKHGSLPAFVQQHAFNTEPDGAVHIAAASMLATMSGPHLLRRWPSDARPNPNPACLRTLEGHGDEVNSVSVSPDGRRVVSASADNTLRVWDLESGQCLLAMRGHDASVRSLSVTPDWRRVVSGSGRTSLNDKQDNTLRVWDLQSGQCMLTLEGHADDITSVSVTPDGRRALSGSRDRTLRVWDLEAGQCLLALEHRTLTASVCVSMVPDGLRAVSGSSGDLRVWDLKSGQCLRTLSGHRDTVESVCVTPDGRRVVSGGFDNTLRVWDLESGACLFTLEGHRKAVQSVCVTPDGRLAVSGSFDKTLRVWDLESGRCLRTLSGHARDVKSVSVTPDGCRAVSGSSDNTLRFWDIERGQCLRSLECHTDRVSALNISPDGRRAVSASFDKTLRVWDTESGQCLNSLSGHRDRVGVVSMTSDGWRVVSGSFDNSLRVWDLVNGQCLHILKGHNSGVWCISITPDGQQAVSGSGEFPTMDHTIRVWDIKSGLCLRTLEGHSDRITYVSVTTNGRRVVSGSWDNTLRIWDLKSGKCLRTLSGQRDGVDIVSATPDGRRAVSGSDDTSLQVWDLETGKCLRTLSGHSGKISSVSVTPDGRRAVSGSSDNTLHVWNLETGKTLRMLEGHCDRVSLVSITSDGRHAVSVSGSSGPLITVSHDTTLRAWDLESGTCVAVVPGTVPWTALAQSVALGRLVAGTENGEVHIFDMVGFSPVPIISTVTRTQT